MARASTPQPALFTVEEYLTFERASEERHEYLNGVIYAMAGESPNHGRLCVNLTTTLARQLRGSPCEAFVNNTKVRCGPYRPHTLKGFYAYPDLVVVCGPAQYHDQRQDVLLNPTVLIEVLSPSTATWDRSEKLQRYRRWLPTLTDYVLVAQDAPIVEHYHRLAPGRWTFDTLEGLEAVLDLESIGWTVPLHEVYERVEFAPEEED